MECFVFLDEMFDYTRLSFQSFERRPIRSGNIEVIILDSDCEIISDNQEDACHVGQNPEQARIENTVSFSFPLRRLNFVCNSADLLVDGKGLNQLESSEEITLDSDIEDMTPELDSGYIVGDCFVTQRAFEDIRKGHWLNDTVG